MSEELLYPSMSGIGPGARWPFEKSGHIRRIDNWRKALCDASLLGDRDAHPVGFFRGGLCKRCAKKAGRS